MACTVCTKFFDNNTNVEVSDLTGAEMLINGVSVIGAEGGITEQENTTLIFSFDNKLPGSGGYYFYQWMYSTDGGNSYIPTSETTISVDATSVYYVDVKCYVNPNQYKITYNYNNPSSIGDYEQNVFFNDEKTQLIDAPSYKEHVFKGWMINGTLYAPLSIYTPTASNVTADGQWVDMNDSSLLPGEELTYEDDGWSETITLLKGIATVLKALGDTSSTNGNGWSIGGSSHKSGSTYVPKSSDNKKATAERTAKKFTVRYSLNGGSGAAIYNPEQVAAGTSISLPDGPTKSGYEFVSWKTNGNAYYTPMDPVVINSNTTFTAQYKKSSETTKDVSVELYFDPTKATCEGSLTRICRVGGKYGQLYNDPKDPSKYIANPLPEPIPRYKDYAWKGWYSSSIGGMQVNDDTVVGNNSNHKLFGQFYNQAVITANGSGGKFTDGSSSKNFYGHIDEQGQAPTIISFITENPTRENYPADGMEGWVYSDGRFVDADTIKSNGQKITVYAKWKQRVKFERNSEEFGPDIPDIFVKHGDKYSELPTIEDTSLQKFIGWYNSASGGTQYSANTTCQKTAGDSLTLYAHYATVKQRVYFDMVREAYKSDTPAPMDFGRPGTYSGLPSGFYYETESFLGWFDEETGGNQVKDADSVTEGATRTLYAHWSSQQGVTFYGEKFRFTENNSLTYVKYYEKGKPYNEFPTPSQANQEQYIGYSFKGWYTYQKGGTRVDPSEIVGNDNARSLHAQYEQNTTQNTVTFDANGGSCNVPAKDVFEGKSVGSLPIADPPSESSRDADEDEKPKTFAGWTVNGTAIDASYVPTSDVTATAQWKEAILLYYVKDALHQ